MSQEPAADTTAASAAGRRPSAGRGTRIGADRHRRADRRQPGALLRRRPPDAVHVAGAHPGLRRAGRGRGRRARSSTVHIRNNDEVQPGQPLFDIDPQPYEIALQRARADYESVRSSVKASAAGVEAARASLQAAEGQPRHGREATPAGRNGCTQEDPGAISVRRLEIAQATREEARSKVRARRGRPAQGAGSGRRQRRRQRAAAQRARRGREGRTRPRAHPACSRRRAAWSPTCAPTSATSRSPARR